VCSCCAGSDELIAAVQRLDERHIKGLGPAVANLLYFSTPPSRPVQHGDPAGRPLPTVRRAFQTSGIDGALWPRLEGGRGYSSLAVLSASGDLAPRHDLECS